MKTKKYDYIEYTDDHDFVIANVVKDGDKIVSVKLTESCLTNWHEYYELIAFLEEIKPVVWKYNDNEQACDDWYTITNMTSQVTNTNTVTPSQGCISDITKMTMTT